MHLLAQSTKEQIVRQLMNDNSPDPETRLRRKELGIVCNSFSSPQSLEIVETMTPANREWMFQCVQDAITASDISHHAGWDDSMLVVWVATFKMHCDCYLGRYKLLPALTKILIEKQNSIDEVYRACYTVCILENKGDKDFKDAIFEHADSCWKVAVDQLGN